MSAKKPPTPDKRPAKPSEVSLVRPSAAEYLTFVATGGNSDASVEMRYEDENVWLAQKMMATLYAVSVPAINQHLKRIFGDDELEEAAVVKQYLTTAAVGTLPFRQSTCDGSRPGVVSDGARNQPVPPCARRPNP